MPGFQRQNHRRVAVVVLNIRVCAEFKQSAYLGVIVDGGGAMQGGLPVFVHSVGGVVVFIGQQAGGVVIHQRGGAF